MLLAGDHSFMWVSHLFSLNNEYYYIYSGLTTLVVLTLVGLYIRSKAAQMETVGIPESRVSFYNFVEAGVGSLRNLIAGIVGENVAEKHMPVLGSIFVFIFTINLMGVIPGFLPATDNINTNLAIAAVVFIYFNYCGIKKNGFAYLKHLMGPIIFLAPIIFLIEVFGLFVRPATLSLRLLGNIYGDHTVLSVFSELAPIGVPIIFMVFGLFVAFVQSFVFTLLSAVYVKLAEEEEEH